MNDEQKQLLGITGLLCMVAVTICVIILTIEVTIRFKL